MTENSDGQSLTVKFVNLNMQPGQNPNQIGESYPFAGLSEEGSNSITANKTGRNASVKSENLYKVNSLQLEKYSKK